MTWIFSTQETINTTYIINASIHKFFSSKVKTHSFMKDVECQLYLHQRRGIKFHLHSEPIKRVLHHALIDRVSDVGLEADQQPSQVLLLMGNILSKHPMSFFYNSCLYKGNKNQ